MYCIRSLLKECEGREGRGVAQKKMENLLHSLHSEGVFEFAEWRELREGGGQNAPLTAKRGEEEGVLDSLPIYDIGRLGG